MKTNLLPLLLAASLLSSCAAYKSGQTPDDVYYSPGREAVAREDRDEYEEAYVKDDNYLRRRVSSRNNRWSSIDDFSYWNDPRFDMRFSTWNMWNTMGWNNWGWNSWNRPAFGWGLGGNGWGSPLILVNNYKNPSRGTNTGSSATAYRNRNYNNDNYLVRDPKTGISSTGNNQNAGFGNMVRRVFSTSNNSGSSNTGSWDRAARTFSSGSSSSFSSGVSSSAGGTSGGTTNSTATSSSAGGRGGRGN